MDVLTIGVFKQNKTKNQPPPKKTKLRQTPELNNHHHLLISGNSLVAAMLTVLTLFRQLLGLWKYSWFPDELLASIGIGKFGKQENSLIDERTKRGAVSRVHAMDD